MSLWVVFVGMIAHVYGDVKFAHYILDLYQADTKHTIGSFAKAFHDMEKPLAYSLRSLFENVGMTPLYEPMLGGKDVCMDLLLEPPSKPIKKKLPLHYAGPTGQLRQGQ